MRLAFNRRLFEIPAPLPRTDETILHVSRYYRFKLPDDPKTRMFRFSHPFAKLLYFIWREGFLLTYYKIRLAMLQRVLINEKALVLSLGRIAGSDRWAVGVGPVDWPESECHVFPSVCVNEVPANCDFLKYVKMLTHFFKRQPDVQLALYHYSPYAGVSVPLELNKVLSDNHDSEPIVSDLALSKKLLKQPLADVVASTPTVKRSRQSGKKPIHGNELFMAGAGVYAYAFILPMLKDFKFHSIIDLNPGLAAAMGHKFGFRYCDTDCSIALKRLSGVKKPVLVVATYHSTHLDIAETAASYNPETKIMLEKPPVTTIDQLESLIRLRQADCHIEIGYNRRYAPMLQKAKALVSSQSGPITVTCIVREKYGVPLTHWYYWPTQGTRIAGNLSHWIDLGVWFIQSKPIAITFMAGSKEFPTDEPSITILFEDGSMLIIVGSDRGNALRGIQEYIDIRRADLTIKIDDLVRMEVQINRHRRVYRRCIRDKGHARMYRAFKSNCDAGGLRFTPFGICFIQPSFISISKMQQSKARNFQN